VKHNNEVVLCSANKGLIITETKLSNELLY